jgi:hypothetical protein
VVRCSAGRHIVMSANQDKAPPSQKTRLRTCLGVQLVQFSPPLCHASCDRFIGHCLPACRCLMRLARHQEYWCKSSSAADTPARPHDEPPSFKTPPGTSKAHPYGSLPRRPAWPWRSRSTTTEAYLDFIRSTPPLSLDSRGIAPMTVTRTRICVLRLR